MSFSLEKSTCLKEMGFSEEEAAYYKRLMEAQIMQLDCLRSEIRQKEDFDHEL